MSTQTTQIACVQRLATQILTMSLIVAGLVAWSVAEAIWNPAPTRHLDESLAEAALLWTSSVLPFPTNDLSTPAPEETRPLPLHPCHQTPQNMKRLDERLDGIDQALARMASGSNPFLAAHYRTDRRRLFDHSNDKGIDCDTLLRLSKTLSQQEGSALSSLTWRERSPGRWPADNNVVTIDPSRFARQNPWRTLPGCIYLGSTSTAPYWPRAQGDALCAAPPEGQAFVAEKAALPRDAGVLRSTLEKWVIDPHKQGNSVQILGRPVPQGAHIWLTMNSKMQMLAQQTVACHTGDRDACQTVSLNADRWNERYEGAAARMVGLIQIDVSTGAIEILASSHSPCFAQDHDGPGHGPECPSLPQAPANRPYQLANHALHGAAMPGSLDKPILALALLRSDLGPYLRGPGRQALLNDLKTSNSAAFLDRLFARDRRFIDAGRLPHVAHAASDLGWNHACDKQSLEHNTLPCGSQDALFGGQARQPTGAQHIVGGRIMMEPEPDTKRWQPITRSYPPDWARQCSDKGWKQCNGAAVDLASEAWGQGHALASPLGVATMLARLGAAANGARQTTPPHLVARIAHRGKPSLLSAPQAQMHAIAPEDARLIIEGMSLTHTAGGTVHAACLAVFEKASRCNGITTIAGKTGTPRFHHHALTLEERARECARLQAIDKRDSREKAALADCYMAPFKWYAALIRSSGKKIGPWDKIVVVLTERNYYRTGLVDSPRDASTDSNIAAEIALRYLSQAYPQIFPEARQGGA